MPSLVTQARGPAGLKIVYIVTKASPIGGAQIHVRDLATAVAARGHAPTVITSGSGTFIDDLRALGIPVIVLTARDLSAEERERLHGSVARILQKGAYAQEALLAEVRALVSESVGRQRDAQAPHRRDRR